MRKGTLLVDDPRDPVKQFIEVTVFSRGTLLPNGQMSKFDREKRTRTLLNVEVIRQITDSVDFPGGAFLDVGEGRYLNVTESYESLAQFLEVALESR